MEISNGLPPSEDAMETEAVYMRITDALADLLEEGLAGETSDLYPNFVWSFPDFGVCFDMRLEGGQ